MTKEERKIWKEERRQAGVYISANIKLKGDIEHIPDGKEILYLRLEYKHLIELLARYSLQRFPDLYKQAIGGDL